FVGRVRKHYVDIYGADSKQVKDCSDGYHFEPSVAERVFAQMLAEQPKITVRTRRQFDARPDNVTLDGTKLTKVRVTNRDGGATEEYEGGCFIDATYE